MATSKNNSAMVYTGYLVFGLLIGSFATTILLNYYKLKQHIQEQEKLNSNT